MGLREYRSLTERWIENEPLEVLKKFYFIFEGEYTEIEYFRKLCDYKKELGINNLIKIIPLEKQGDIEHVSHPKNLLSFARDKKIELMGQGNFDEDIDEFYIVFDRDSFKPVDRKVQEYLNFIEEAQKEFKLAVTSPCFEVFLLLHKENIVEEYLKDNHQSTFNIYKLFNPNCCEKDITAKIAQKVEICNLRINRKISKHTVASKLCSAIYGKNPKNNLDFNDFKTKIPLAIEQEKMIAQDPLQMEKLIGSNIGSVIELMKQDPRQKKDD